LSSGPDLSVPKSVDQESLGLSDQLCRNCAAQRV
jgi:hypothetical protein